MQTRYKVCWYASIFIVNQKYVQMRFYLYFRNTEDFLLPYQCPWQDSAYSSKTSNFASKNIFYSNSLPKHQFSFHFKFFSYDTKLRRYFQAILACLRKSHFQFKYRLFCKLLFYENMQEQPLYLYVSVADGVTILTPWSKSALLCSASNTGFYVIFK